MVNSNVQENQSRLYGNISIRVLSERFNDALAALRALAVDVRSESTSGQDVTEEYTDLSAKLRNLQAAEAQLLKLMEQAGKVTDILEVQKELVKTRGEIEQTKGRMQYLEQSSALAFIQVTLEQSKLTVEFNATARNVKEGEKIYFVPTVSGGFTPYSYEWDFGDGQTSTEDSAGPRLPERRHLYRLPQGHRRPRQHGYFNEGQLYHRPRRLGSRQYRQQRLERVGRVRAFPGQSDHLAGYFQPGLDSHSRGVFTSPGGAGGKRRNN